MSALDANSGIRERRSQLHFDARRFTSFDVLKVERRTGQHFDAALQHTARGADTGLVLIEAVLRRVSRLPHVDGRMDTPLFRAVAGELDDVNRVGAG